MTVMQLTARPRQSAGWRDGKPLEDPDKQKRWGFVTARPSEYLVHVRRGRVRARSSGQGQSCFKWPWDAVAIVPTSLQRLAYRADQITRERVGVEVVGLAVYRIAEPLLAYRVLNFSFPERAQEKLEETLTSMFVGATRRLVANLSVDDCLQKRKAALADELIREIAPVIGGQGRPDDETPQGWGVVIDSIEIQEVRVLSDRVFEAMQTPYRAALDLEARSARAAAEKDVATREAACGQAIEEARIAAEMEVSARKAALLRARDEAEQARQLDAAAREAELSRRRVALAMETAAEETRAAVARQALAAEAAQAEVEAAAAHGGRAAADRARAVAGRGGPRRAAGGGRGRADRGRGRGRRRARRRARRRGAGRRRRAADQRREAAGARRGGGPADRGGAADADRRRPEPARRGGGRRLVGGRARAQRGREVAAGCRLRASGGIIAPWLPPRPRPPESSSPGTTSSRSKTTIGGS
ncbi:MAG: SPFH domain-containing protein [Myxococcales bacterium]|nr:SPFH domain-containing protein [Myxococcales bacterium]